MSQRRRFSCKPTRSQVCTARHLQGGTPVLIRDGCACVEVETMLAPRVHPTKQSMSISQMDEASYMYRYIMRFQEDRDFQDHNVPSMIFDSMGGRIATPTHL